MKSGLNTREQGDLGELSALEWLKWNGAVVFAPVGHSPNVDLVADFGSSPIRIEVKTSCSERNGRWSVKIATMGGNQSWNGIVKKFEPSRCDYLFVHVGDGRRWFIPTHALECDRTITLSGPRYSEFEIEPGRPLAEASPLRSRRPLGGCQSGQMDGAVNATAMPTQVRILPPPSSSPGPSPHSHPSGHARIWGKRRITIPARVMSAGQLEIGDDVRVQVDGDGRLSIARVSQRPAPPETAPASRR